MTNDERKTLEDRIHNYGVATGEGRGEREWGKVMDELTKIQLKEEKGR